MRLLAVVLCGLAVASGAHAATLDLSTLTTGVLATAQAANNPSANDADFTVGSTRRAALFQFINTAGTGTVELQMTCTPGAATDWATVANSSKAMTANSAVMLDVLYPACRYRASVTACTGCSVTVNVFGLPRMQ